jgi:hypothetical protein
MSVTAEVHLDFPITVDGETFDKFTMRRPKVSDNLWAAKLKGSDFEKGVSLLARLCGVAPEVMAELDEFDAGRLNDQLEAFRGSGAT